MEIMVDLQQTYHKLIDVLINNDINNVIVTLYFKILLEWKLTKHIKYDTSYSHIGSIMV